MTQEFGDFVINIVPLSTVSEVVGVDTSPIVALMPDNLTV